MNTIFLEKDLNTKILQQLLEHGRALTAADLYHLLGKDVTRVATHASLSRLVKAGYLRKNGKGAGAVYEPSNKYKQHIGSVYRALLKWGN